MERDQGRAQREILFHEWERQYNFSMGAVNYFLCIINQFIEYGSCYVQATSMLLLQKRKFYLPEQKVLQFGAIHPIFCPSVCFLAPFLHAQVVIFLAQFLSLFQ